MLAVLALAVRILVPTGYMPSQGAGRPFELVICTGDGMVTVGHNAPGAPAPAKDRMAGHACVFADHGVADLGVHDRPDFGSAAAFAAITTPPAPSAPRGDIRRSLPPPQTGPPLRA
jgi:hypothetical protein